MKPTCELRLVPCLYGWCLQQKWVSEDKMKEEWRLIPKVNLR